MTGHHLDGGQTPTSDGRYLRFSKEDVVLTKIFPVVRLSLVILLIPIFLTSPQLLQGTTANAQPGQLAVAGIQLNCESHAQIFVLGQLMTFRAPQTTVGNPVKRTAFQLECNGTLEAHKAARFEFSDQDLLANGAQISFLFVDLSEPDNPAPQDLRSFSITAGQFRKDAQYVIQKSATPGGPPAFVGEVRQNSTSTGYLQSGSGGSLEFF